VKYSSNARFFVWRGEAKMHTQPLKNSQISQISLLTVQEIAELAKVSTIIVYYRTYRISEKDRIDYLENSGYYNDFYDIRSRPVC
jgi:hypothetical protein